MIDAISISHAFRFAGKFFINGRRGNIDVQYGHDLAIHIAERRDDRDLGRVVRSELAFGARIASAQMDKDANIKEAEQERNAQVKQFENRVTEEQSRMRYDLREADNLKQTNQRKAIADMAQARKEMGVKKDVVAREQNVVVAETEQQIRVAKGDIDRMKQELEGSMIKPTAAQCYAIQKHAEAT